MTAKEHCWNTFRINPSPEVIILMEAYADLKAREAANEAWKECTKRLCVAAGFDFEGLYFPTEAGHWFDDYLTSKVEGGTT